MIILFMNLLIINKTKNMERLLTLITSNELFWFFLFDILLYVLTNAVILYDWTPFS